MIFIMAIYHVYGVFSGSDVLYTHTHSVIWCFSGQFLQGILRMLVANASGSPFNPYRRTTLIAWSLMIINIVSFAVNGQALINEKYMFLFINFIIWSATAHYTYYVLNELMVILNIHMFTVKKPANPQESSPTKKKVN